MHLSWRCVSGIMTCVDQNLEVVLCKSLSLLSSEPPFGPRFDALQAAGGIVKPGSIVLVWALSL